MILVLSTFIAALLHPSLLLSNTNVIYVLLQHKTILKECHCHLTTSCLEGIVELIEFMPTIKGSIDQVLLSISKCIKNELSHDQKESEEMVEKEATHPLYRYTQFQPSIFLQQYVKDFEKEYEK